MLTNRLDCRYDFEANCMLSIDTASSVWRRMLANGENITVTCPLWRRKLAVKKNLRSSKLYHLGNRGLYILYLLRCELSKRWVERNKEFVKGENDSNHSFAEAQNINNYSKETKTNLKELQRWKTDLICCCCSEKTRIKAESWIQTVQRHHMTNNSGYLLFFFLVTGICLIMSENKTKYVIIYNSIRPI